MLGGPKFRSQKRGTGIEGRQRALLSGAIYQFVWCNFPSPRPLSSSIFRHKKDREGGSSAKREREKDREQTGPSRSPPQVTQSCFEFRKISASSLLSPFLFELEPSSVPPSVFPSRLVAPSLRLSDPSSSFSPSFQGLPVIFTSFSSPSRPSLSSTFDNWVKGT